MSTDDSTDSSGVTVGDLLDALFDAGQSVELLGGLAPDVARAVGVAGVTHDSRRVGSGTLFACLRGDHTDGHRFARQAVASGAVGLLVERSAIASGEIDVDAAGDIVVLSVDSTRAALGPLSSAAYGAPSSKLLTFGITGTNGKTTTAAMLAAALTGSGHQVGVIGTLTGPRTTPEAPELQAQLADFVAGGKTAAVLEVSSHALELHRVDGTRFDVAVFTNLGRDHLDLHGTEENYFRAKARLFNEQFAQAAVINVSDAAGRRLRDELTESDAAPEVIAYSDADAGNVRAGAARLDFEWRDQNVTVPIGGRFNVSNALATLTAAAAAGIDERAAGAGLANLEPVAGRFEAVLSDAAEQLGISVVVDYAHTPDGLEHLLLSARDAAGDAAVHVVFGCGGDRDADKRAAMGAVAARLADRAVVTSDNPRSEDPMMIIDAIVEGARSVDGADVMLDVEPDRERAIGRAIEASSAGDVVVVAGKGHERTQEFADVVVEFDDVEVVRSMLARRVNVTAGSRPEDHR